MNWISVKEALPDRSGVYIIQFLYKYLDTQTKTTGAAVYTLADNSWKLGDSIVEPELWCRLPKVDMGYWISVKEKKPQDLQRVLVFNPFNEYRTIVTATYYTEWQPKESYGTLPTFKSDCGYSIEFSENNLNEIFIWSEDGRDRKLLKSNCVYWMPLPDKPKQ